MLTSKTVALCVCGGIAAYKACEITSRLKKLGADVFVVMTKSAQEFVAPLTFETLSNNRVITDMFDPNRQWEVEHISLAKKADLFLIAPATANIVAKLANGIADDFLTTTVMAANCPILVAPAMNTAMLKNPAYINNESILTGRGYFFAPSGEGKLACGDSGKGRLAEVDDIISAAVNILLPRQDFLGKRVLVTLGSTRENIDPVRFIGNFSSGKMGVALVDALASRGASVTAVCGHVSVDLPKNCRVLIAESAQKMHDICVLEAKNSDFDYMIFAAAVGDYRVKTVAKNKLKDEKLTLELVKNPDIAASVKTKARKIIFAAETENLEENARKKLAKKGADMVIANDITQDGAGFNTDTNIATIMTKTHKFEQKIQKKSELAHIILDKIAQNLG